MTHVSRLYAVLFVLAWVAPVRGQQPDFIPLPESFAPAEKATYIAGELVYIDPVNRRGGIRLEGDEMGRYFSGPPHYFALLPYATVWSHGALAEIRDIPLGTHVHGYFFLPPKGEEQTIPPLPEEQKRFTVPHNHALCLEDDFSFYQRRGQAWKVVSIDPDKEKLNVEPVLIPTAGSDAAATATPRVKFLPGAGPAGGFVKDGISARYTFDIDVRTEIWKDGQLASLAAIQPGMTVQLNLAWAQGWGQKEFRVGRLWLDEASRVPATERQRQRHVQYERERWAPGRIDQIEHFDYGGGIITLTLFEVDQEVLNDLWKDKDSRIAVAVAEKTRRTWFHRADRKFGKLVEWKAIDNPPLGSSGIQLRLKFAELLAGYTPGGFVRVKADSWKFVSMPPEERITSQEDQQRQAKMVLPW